MVQVGLEQSVGTKLVRGNMAVLTGSVCVTE